MRVFDCTKTQELKEYDLSKGKLEADKLLIVHHDAVQAVEGKSVEEIATELRSNGKSVETIGSDLYLVTEVYENGGKNVEKIQPIEAIPAKEPWDEYEDILIYVPFTESELSVVEANKAISEAKEYLSKTDYIVLKIAEALAEEDVEEVKSLQTQYAEQLTKRKQARATVNEKESVTSIYLF